MIKNIVKFKHLLYFIIPLFLIASCSNQSKNRIIDRNILIDSVFKQLKTLEIDSLRKIYAFYRGSQPLYVINCYYNDSCQSLAALLMRDDNNAIVIKVGNKQVSIDSLEYYYPLQKIKFSKERIIYCFKVMEKLFLEEISTSCDFKGLSIKKDSLKFYYLFDTLLNKEYDKDNTLKKLDCKWWVEK